MRKEDGGLSMCEAFRSVDPPAEEPARTNGAPCRRGSAVSHLRVKSGGWISPPVSLDAMSDGRTTTGESAAIARIRRKQWLSEAEIGEVPLYIPRAKLWGS